MPAQLAQRDGLTGEPGARTGAFRVAPMFRFGDGLAVEFEKEGGMSGRSDIWIEILVAGDTGIGAHVKAAQIAHPGADAGGVIPIGPGVSAQPGGSGAVAIFTGNRFGRIGGSGALRGGDGLERRMTDGAA